MIVTFTNQKGGVGKTTSALNVGVAAARRGRRVLLVDLDPQYALTRQAGIRLSDLPMTLVQLLTGQADAEDILVHDHHGCDWLAGHPDMASVEHTLARSELGVGYLAEKLNELDIESYDLVVLDCPPNLGQLSINAVVAADRVCVCVSAEDEGAAQGCVAVRETIQRVRGGKTPMDLIVTRSHHNRVVEHLIDEALDAMRLPTAIERIPSRTVVQQAAAARTPLVLYAPDSLPAVAYDSLAHKLLAHRKPLKAAA